MSWEERIRTELGEWALPVIVWSRCDGPDRVIYAFPSARLATLRHWRDEFETSSFVGLEASKWARLLLKGHGGSLLSCVQTPSSDCIETGEALASLARELWTEDASHWSSLAGVESLPIPDPLLSREERFQRVEAWLAQVRAVADATRR